MEADNFIAKLKANGSNDDVFDLAEVYEEYKSILLTISTTNQGQFSVNVLCTLCRNLDKVQSWREKISYKELVMLSIDCVRETRNLNKTEKVKTLACIYHIHKFIVRQSSPVVPQLILKLSYMPFECDKSELYPEYSKTYWNLIADRILYFEKLKSDKLAIIKLLPKLSEDILSVIEIYDTVQFCGNVLTFLLKKLFLLYSDDYSKELNEFYLKFFDVLIKNPDLKNFKKLGQKESLDIFLKFNDCLYTVTENASKKNFKDSALSTAVRACTTMLGHNPDIFHCFQTFYLNSYCCILTDSINPSFVETVLCSMLKSCETTKKLGYENTLNVLYPFLGQFLRLYIEYSVAKCERKWTDCLSKDIQIVALKLILVLMDRMCKTEQLSKCEGCKVKTGLHDSLRLSFLVKYFISLSLSHNIDVNEILPFYFKVVEQQYSVLNTLFNKGCVNFDKCFRKLQTDVHNTAILLNKANLHEFSIKLFDIYVTQEYCHLKSDVELKNISRALYNKSICEMDCKVFESALKDAYLSLVFAEPEGLSMDKYMNLVMDIKSKALKQNSGHNEGDQIEMEQDKLQMTTVLDICDMVVKDKDYGNLKLFLRNVKFSIILKHEFQTYVKLWPSILPIAGVWLSMEDLVEKKYCHWLNAEKEDVLLLDLYGIVIQTPSVVRTIHNEHFVKIITKLLVKLENNYVLSTEKQIVLGTLLFLKAEYDIADASQKHEWKMTEPNVDPDLNEVNRTVPDECAAIQRALSAVHLWTKIIKKLNEAPSNNLLGYALQINEVFVQQLLHMSHYAHALQLAYICCHLAQHVGDKEAYLRNVGTLLYYGQGPNERLFRMMTLGGKLSKDLTTKESVETKVIFMSNAAIYYCRCGKQSVAAKLVQLTQAGIIDAYEKYGEINLDLAIGRLMEAQTLLCKDSGPSTLSAVIGTQRHYLTIPNMATKWTARRLFSLTLKQHISIASLHSVAICRALLLWRRARSSAGVALPAANALAQAKIFALITNTHNTQDAQVKIDQRLKFILGLQSSSETQSYIQEPESYVKQLLFTPKQEAVEVMLDCQTFKKTQTSPSLPCTTVPGFKAPDFLTHNRKCECHACQTPFCFITASQICVLEASTYYRAKEMEISRNYFEGVLKTFDLVEAKLKGVIKNYREYKFEELVIESVEKILDIDFRNVQIEGLVECAFFELTHKNYGKADDYIVRIHEIMQGIDGLNPYLPNEVMNVTIVSARLRNVVSKIDLNTLTIELENLKLSPERSKTELQTTPESKPVKPPIIEANKILNKEDIPKLKPKVIKLNLDEMNEEKEPVKPKRTTKRTEFKIPVPITNKAVLENVTPRPTRSVPKLTLTKPSLEEKSNNDLEQIQTPQTALEKTKTEFFTPLEATPDQQFFTPMTSVKTYSKKSLRVGIVKNLEKEFATPKDKEHNKIPDKSLIQLSTTSRRSKIETGSLNTLKDKRSTLKRATSPGKLGNVEKPTLTRTSRLRKPVNFSIDNDDADKNDFC